MIFLHHRAKHEQKAHNLIKNPAESFRQAALPITLILLLLLGWYSVIQYNRTLTQTTITAYQHTQLEIVRALARGIKAYVPQQVSSLDQASVADLEQEIFEKFVAPVRLQNNGAAWMYAPNHVVYDQNSDFPKVYRGKSIAQIFEIQTKAGASHYEEMIRAVADGREGTGWYIWLPEIGQEIAAWTPVQAGGFRWTIGLSAPLSEILEHTGATRHIRASILGMSLVTLVTLGLLGVWAHSAIQRRRAYTALAYPEQRFQQLVSSIRDCIYMTRLNQNGQQFDYYFAPNIQRLTGYPPEKFSAGQDFWQTLVHQDDALQVAEHLAKLRRGYASLVEYRLIQANGNIIWVRDNAQAEKEANGYSVVIYGVVSDITESKQAQVALTQARDEALAANHLKSQLLADVSHDLRTPLSTILGYAQLLLFGLHGPLSPSQQEMINEIADNVGYLSDMVNTLLDQARLEAGQLKLVPSNFTPAEVLFQVEAAMRVPAEAKGLDLKTYIEPELPDTLWGDRGRIQQILANLVNNAIKFTAYGTVSVRFFQPKAGYWALQVADTGRGIAPEDQSLIFEPFRQVDGTTTSSDNGTGLGLSIVQQLTTLMDGQISVESAVGCGSTFTVVLPLILHDQPLVATAKSL